MGADTGRDGMYAVTSKKENLEGMTQEANTLSLVQYEKASISVDAMTPAAAAGDPWFEAYATSCARDLKAPTESPSHDSIIMPSGSLATSASNTKEQKTNILFNHLARLREAARASSRDITSARTSTSSFFSTASFLRPLEKTSSSSTPYFLASAKSSRVLLVSSSFVVASVADDDVKQHATKSTTSIYFRVKKMVKLPSSTWFPRHDGGPPMVWHPSYSVSWPENHRFAMWKFDDLCEEAVRSGLTSKEDIFEAPPASREAIGAAHDGDYVQRFEADTLDPTLWRRIGFTQRPSHADLVRRTVLEVGGTALAADLARKYGMACNLGGGTHHAHRSYGSGYTIYNDLAVAALAHKGRVVVCDVDVHQGDGTADILKHVDDAFTFSIHCADNYPFGFVGQHHLGKDRSDLDVALPARSGDAQVMDALKSHLPKLLDDFTPSLVLYDAGVDADTVDGLGKLDCTMEGMLQRDTYALEQCVLRRIPVATVIGGGYDRDRRRLARRHSIILHAATNVWRKYFRTFLS